MGHMISERGKHAPRRTPVLAASPTPPECQVLLVLRGAVIR